MRVDSVRALVDPPPTAAVQLAEVEAACGFPSPAQDYHTTEIDLNVHLMPNRLSTYVIRARGHSMTQAGIFDGDELIVDRSITPADGHVVVAVIDGEMTVKRLRFTATGVVLSAENPEFGAIEIAELSELHVWGVVTRSLHHIDRA